MAKVAAEVLLLLISGVHPPLRLVLHLACHAL